MAGQGRKRKPDALKEIEGTARRDRSNPDAPTPDTGVPDPPEWLPPLARSIFETLAGRLAGMRYASTSHTEPLALCAMALAEVQELTAEIEAMGYFQETTTMNKDVVMKPIPAVTQRSDAMRRAMAILTEFGLTPSSCSKVSVPKGNKEANPFGEFLKIG